MNTKNKLFFFLIIFLWLATGGVAYLFFAQKEKIEDEYIRAKQNFTAERDRLKKRLSSSENEIRVLTAEKEKLKTEKEGLEAEIKKISQDIKHKEKEYKTLERRYQSTLAKQESLSKQLKKIIGEKIVLKKELENLRSEPFLAKILEEKTRLTLAQKNWEKEKEKLVQALTKKLLAQEKEEFSLKKQLSELKQSLEVAQRDKQRLKRQVVSIVELFRRSLKKISEVRSAKELSDEITKIKDSLASELKGIELPQVVVRAKKPAQTQQGRLVDNQQTNLINKRELRGEIFRVSKQYNFVIIDLGENKGLRKGDLLAVYRDEEKIGEIKIIQLREEVSAADIVSFKKEIKRGDKVIKK
ncbi:MAG: hypothetical protein B5M48_04395 [Candidatus Omnitrophica bacterium 4484_213]|nr:MAG: hypothetical protein B5M48_04395 [Candidatus Omnitrophica bacterium 4484_213]